MMIWSPPQDGQPPVCVTEPSRASLLASLHECIVKRRGFSVATINLDHVVKLHRDANFRKAYLSQTHVTADGRPIVWLSRLSGQSSVTLATGSDLLEPVLALCADLSAPLAFFGSRQDVLDEAADVLQARYPGLRVVTRLAPPMGFDPQGPAAAAAMAEIAAAGARVCVLALGAPKQELFAARALQDYPEMGFLSFGAGLDFIAGAQTRAPRLVRALAAEWLWRLAKNPKRLALRYGACLMILPRLGLRAMRQRRARPRDVVR